MERSLRLDRAFHAGHQPDDELADELRHAVQDVSLASEGPRVAVGKRRPSAAYGNRSCRADGAARFEAHSFRDRLPARLFSRPQNRIVAAGERGYLHSVSRPLPPSLSPLQQFQAVLGGRDAKNRGSQRSAKDRGTGKAAGTVGPPRTKPARPIQRFWPTRPATVSIRSNLVRTSSLPSFISTKTAGLSWLRIYVMRSTGAFAGTCGSGCPITSRITSFRKSFPCSARFRI